jgi:hypothetical protein
MQSVQVLNKAASSRLISKQEAVMLASLPLCSCTDTVESVSVSPKVQATQQE